jgi:hypothetical protein
VQWCEPCISVLRCYFGSVLKVALLLALQIAELTAFGFFAQQLPPYSSLSSSADKTAIALGLLGTLMLLHADFVFHPYPLPCRRLCTAFWGFLLHLPTQQEPAVRRSQVLKLIGTCACRLLRFPVCARCARSSFRRSLTVTSSTSYGSAPPDAYNAFGSAQERKR